MKPLAAPRIVHAGPIFSVERLECPNPRGGDRPPIVRDIVRHPGAVAVVPVLDDGRLVLIRNRRDAVDAWLFELCAGKLERGEDPAAAAGRELEEETGYVATTIEKLGEFYTSPGFADELMRVFEARGLRPSAQRLEEDERIVVEIRTVDETMDMIASGEIRDGKTLAGLLLWLRRRPR